ncbi:MAG: glycosyltransferase [Paludibacteraceae bacterium]|nr:glycosyltransferase [Paludibacteraceae bacterium]MBP5480506.1 glycosyltransferase [Paludibacteraceae bacterium]
MNVDISIIIAVYNNTAWLKMIFAMLQQQTYKNFEVVIADDGSSPENVQEMKEMASKASFPVQHIWHEDKGWRKDIILNKAVVASKAEYLVFLDGDCIPEKHFVKDHYDLRQKGYVISGRRVQLTQDISDKLTPELVEKGYLRSCFFPLLFSKERHSENVIRIPLRLRFGLIKPGKGCLLGCNFGIYKSDLLKVNGFDERYLSPATGEDTDLEARLSRVGIPVLRYKFVCRVYHRKHIRKEVIPNPNVPIFEENNRLEVGYTPYGIDQSGLPNT